MQQTSIETIEICSSCNGKGKVPQAPEHLADETYVIIDCETCLGSGRIRVKTTKETRPFVID